MPNIDYITKPTPFLLRSQSPFHEKGGQPSYQLPDVKYNQGTGIGNLDKATLPGVSNSWGSNFGAYHNYNTNKQASNPAVTSGEYVGAKFGETWDKENDGYVRTRSNRGFEVRKERAAAEGRTKKVTRLEKRQQNFNERQGNVWGADLKGTQTQFDVGTGKTEKGKYTANPNPTQKKKQKNVTKSVKTKTSKPNTKTYKKTQIQNKITAGFTKKEAKNIYKGEENIQKYKDTGKEKFAKRAIKSAKKSKDDTMGDQLHYIRSTDITKSDAWKKNPLNMNSPLNFKGWGDQATTSIDQHSGMRVRPRAVTQIPYGELGMPMESTLSKADNMRMRGFQDPNDTTNFEDNRIASRGNFKGGMQTINDNNVGQVPPAINPDTYNQPLIPTEGQMTMANLQTPVGQVGAVGNEALWKGPVGA